jgi:hypothetical protein
VPAPNGARRRRRQPTERGTALEVASLAVLTVLNLIRAGCTLVQWGLMPQRVIALLLALVLFWSGFTTQEQAISFAPSTIAQIDGVSGDLPQSVHDGSIDDHHLDDQPGQTQAEGAMELLPLLMTRPAAGVPTLTMSRPLPYAMAAWLEPYLAGPQRPPCATHLVA